MPEDLLKTKFERLVDAYFSSHEVPTIHGQAEGIAAFGGGVEEVFTPEIIKERLLRMFDHVQETRLAEGKSDFDRIIEDTLHEFCESLPVHFGMTDEDRATFDSFFEKMIPAILTQIKKERAELLSDGHEAKVIKLSDYRSKDGSRK
ncbi:MAG: hypothetical protein KBD73_01880 [Candidatus Magasanikbacteria bacterium]|nr:hypothetical protein [Candidatus Magasanikbacteria bacterium]